MDTKEYPILNIYMNAIEKLHKQKHELALIFLIGGTSELILREITNDEKTGMEKLICRAKVERKITSKNAKLFEAIRECRNKYIHINANKVLNDYSFFYVKDGLFENINELYWNDLTEANLEEVVRIHISEDSAFIYSHFKELVKSLMKS